MKKPVIAAIVVFVVVVIGLIIQSSMNLAQVKVEVCMEFNGRQNCATSSGQSRELAQRTATTGACALIAGGVGDTIACEHRTPVSVKWLK